MTNEPTLEQMERANHELGQALAATDTPAQLDPSKVKAGDTVTLTRGKAVHIDEVALVSHGHSTHLNMVDGRGTYIVDPANAYGWTLTAHQPAPKPEWKPGTTGTATLNSLVSGASSLGMRAMRIIDEDGTGSFVFENSKWIRDDATTWSVSDFVPDETRPLPTRDEVKKVLGGKRNVTVWAPGGRGDGALTERSAHLLAEAVLALLRGESA